MSDKFYIFNIEQGLNLETDILSGYTYMNDMYQKNGMKVWVYFNNEDISYVYEYVYGEDKVKRIYDLYKGNLKIDSSDFKMLKTGFVDARSFNFQSKQINEQIESLIGKKLNVNYKKVILEEQVNKELDNIPSFEEVKKEEITNDNAETTTQTQEKPKSFFKRLFTKKN